jgi:hypothetical protein
MFMQPRGELSIARFLTRIGILSQKLKLLPHAPPNDRVIRVETHRNGLAIVDLLVGEVVHQRLQLRAARHASREQTETLSDLVYAPLRDGD